MKVSELKPYSIGIVAANKPLSEWVIDVTPIEELTMLNGEINSDQHEETVDSQDQTGAAYQIKLTKSASIKATWLPMGNGNRKTPPDVRRGAEVILWRMADSNDMYWMTLKDDMALRKLETVVYAWSATKNEADPQNQDTSYFLELSTHRKLIHFHTSKRNGEPFGYDIQINTDEGFIKFQDDAGNFIILDSKERQIAIKNTDGSYIDLNKKNLTISVPETVKIIAKDLIHEIAERIDTKAGTSITEETKTHTTKASQELKEEAGKVVVVADSTLGVTAGGAINVKGNGVTIGDRVSLKG